MVDRRPPDERGFTGAGGDEVAPVLRAAGRRGEVPAGDLARIRAAFRAEWERSDAVRRGPRARLAAWWHTSPGARWAMSAAAAALVILTVGVLFTSLRAPEQRASLARVESIDGSGATLARDGSGRGRPLRSEMQIGEGDWIETPEPGAAPPARVGLRLAAASLRIDAGSRLRLRSGGVIELERGALYIDSDTASPPLAVHTPLGLVRDIGTQFEVRLLGGAERGLRVRVRRGEVSVRAANRDHALVAGEELGLDPDGGATRGTVSGFDAEWSWILAVSPPFELEGRRVRELLEWFARETGREVRYGDADAEATAETRFEGAATLRAPDETALLWLDGAGLAARLEDGSLLVSRAER